MLIALSGLPGVGKTSIALALARSTGAVYLRMDSIEQALRYVGITVEGEGYAVGYAVAADNLRLGRVVIADCVDPWPLTRREWQGVAQRAGVRILHIEIVCSDPEEHRRRVESRQPDIPGHELPTWSDVLARDYQPWEEAHLVIDTAHTTVEESVRTIRSAAGI
jgi:predicted kinase